MGKKRMTGIDYRREWNLIQQSEKSLKAHVDSRLRELIEKYPEAVVVDKGRDKMLCKHITAKWFDSLSTYGMIGYIEKIEAWSAKTHKFKQLTIDKIYEELPSEMKDTLKKLSD